MPYSRCRFHQPAIGGLIFPGRDHLAISDFADDEAVPRLVKPKRKVVQRSAVDLPASETLRHAAAGLTVVDDSEVVLNLDRLGLRGEGRPLHGEVALNGHIGGERLRYVRPRDGRVYRERTAGAPLQPVPNR